MNQDTRIRAQLEAGKIQRFHIVPSVGPTYTVGQHSFNMLVLLFELHPSPSMTLVKAVTHHDLSERYVGDISAVATMMNVRLANGKSELEHRANVAMGLTSSWVLSPDEKRWLRALDRVELYLYCADQVAMGNRNYAKTKKLVGRWLLGAPDVPLELRDFVARYQWERNGDFLLEEKDE